MWRFTCLKPHIAVVYPLDDLIVHDVHGGDTCVCGPAVEPVPCKDGSMSWIFAHHSLDGREERERQQQE